MFNTWRSSNGRRIVLTIRAKSHNVPNLHPSRGWRVWFHPNSRSWTFQTFILDSNHEHADRQKLYSANSTENKINGGSDCQFLRSSLQNYWYWIFDRCWGLWMWSSRVDLHSYWSRQNWSIDFYSIADTRFQLWSFSSRRRRFFISRKTVLRGKRSQIFSLQLHLWFRYGVMVWYDANRSWATSCGIKNSQWVGNAWNQWWK